VGTVFISSVKYAVPPRLSRRFVSFNLEATEIKSTGSPEAKRSSIA
jgi:hypothetical protein